ncbi:Oidioi.mRNA.OKI2018_I69.chr2.g5546.t1.cds [Oikopleura dioica]|uniref:Oidioi.mRNA.OKI2018_I69.chr2.g5546.t1.cds n=1 Tax=Oikopleura dioica TaxID=34765 RepID=A0ABN7T512_OIKDI|nr:Oidioi.mRNA.OKI2018_I69.chr2.g5546.t1.cds [Oikopleura dioica]
MRKNSLFFTLPGEHYWDYIRFICDDDRVDDQSGEIKIQTAETAENLPCKPMVLTKTFLETYFNSDGYIGNGFYSGLKLKDYDFHLTNLTITSKGKFALAWMSCNAGDSYLGENCDHPFSDRLFGRVKIVDQSIYRKVICF